ncbi:MAG: DUF1559 domain-containing protein [Planctomycetota bacterium]
MNSRTHRRRVSTGCLLVALLAGGFLGVGVTKSHAQQSTMVSDRFVPADALGVLDVRPSRMMSHDIMRLMPVEVMDAWTDENVGMRVGQIRFARLVMPMPMPGSAYPDFGIVVAFNDAFSPDRLKPGLVNTGQTKMIGGKECYTMADGSAPVYLHAASPKLWIMGTETYLPKVMDAMAGGGNGPLSQILAGVPMEGDIQLVLDMKPIAPMLSGVVQMQMQDAPPFLRRLPNTILLVDAMWNSIDLENMSFDTFGNWTIKAKSEQAAEEIESIVRDTLEDAATELVGLGQASIPDDDAVSEALRSYIARLGDELKPMLMLRREGDLLKSPKIESAPNVATVGVLVGLLLPAVQAAREAARRMSASNNLKQIGLAMHNYHAAYRKLPFGAIRDENGKPLLSWRVAILPFIEQQALYEEFHLDEPWDSEHNRTLIDKMPMIYIDPSNLPLPGKTVFQAPSGKGLMQDESVKQVVFRDVRDGLSNTIMVAETSLADAVTWTQPVDWEVDMDRPLAGTGEAHVGGFHVLLGDGAVIFIAKSVDETLFRGMLTKAGQEVINARF